MEATEDKTSTWRSFVKVLHHIPGAALMFAVVPLLVLGYLGWYHYGADHLDQALYSLQKSNLSVTPRPDWIKSNVLDEVFQNGRLDRISLLDPNANATIAQAFETHSWVKSATRVTKSAGGQVEVDLVYRRPAAMVYYAPQRYGKSSSVVESDATEGTLKPGFYPVDKEGIILPTQDFSEQDVLNYFLVFAEAARPAGDVGMSFGDARISEALQLCVHLEPIRIELRLQEIWVHHDHRSSGPSPWIMTVVTKDKHRIVWGHAPDLETSGEATVERKQEQMIAWLATVRQGNSIQQQIDLRSTKLDPAQDPPAH